MVQSAGRSAGLRAPGVSLCDSLRGVTHLRRAASQGPTSMGERARRKLSGLLRAGLRLQIVLLCPSLLVEAVTRACPVSRNGGSDRLHLLMGSGQVLGKPVG